MSMRYWLIMLLLLCRSVCFCQSTKSSTTTEDRIIDTIAKIAEVKKRNKDVEKQSKGKRHLSFLIYKKPNKKFKYYWVKVTENNGSTYATHYNFYVDPKTLSISFFDPTSNWIVGLEAWQNRNNENFYIFLSDFSTSKEFQLKRISKNFKDFTISPEGDSTCESFNKSKWQHVELITGSYVNIIYDNFQLLQKDSDERVYSIQAIEACGANFYYFKRIKGEWYLIKRVTSD